MDDRRRTLAALTIIVGFGILIVVIIGVVISGKKTVSPVPDDNAIKIIFVTPTVAPATTETPTQAPQATKAPTPTKKPTPKPSTPTPTGAASTPTPSGATSTPTPTSTSTPTPIP